MRTLTKKRAVWVFSVPVGAVGITQALAVLFLDVSVSDAIYSVVGAVLGGAAIVLAIWALQSWVSRNPPP